MMRQGNQLAFTSERHRTDRSELGPGLIDQLPFFVIPYELETDPSVVKRGPLQDTEPSSKHLSEGRPETGVGGLSTSGNASLRPIFKIHPRQIAQQRSLVLQQWEGTVVEIKGDSFGARMRNLTDPKGPEEWATLLLGEISEEDRCSVQPGAVFYWSVGYLIEPYGQRRTASTIYFRRLPAWSSADLERARNAAEEYRDIFPDSPVE